MRHAFECPEFSEKGTCGTLGCKLPHVLRRRNEAGVEEEEEEEENEERQEGEDVISGWEETDGDWYSRGTKRKAKDDLEGISGAAGRKRSNLVVGGEREEYLALEDDEDDEDEDNDEDGDEDEEEEDSEDDAASISTTDLAEQEGVFIELSEEEQDSPDQVEEDEEED